MTKHEIVLMSIINEDKPGVTSSLTEILSKHNATILDIGQANIHQSLSLGILFPSRSRYAREYFERSTFQIL